MVSINTNLSSLMVQSNLTQATNGLNKAIERLSTGYKINHASDNAANYSIANSYESKLSSYEVAASNVQSGLDLLSVAQDTISTMQDHGSRLQALITQARNGTYGAQSLTAMTQEAGALISEIQRMYMNTEYNGITLFDNIALPGWAKEVKANAGIEEGETVGLTTDLTPKANGFIADIETVTPDIVVESAGDLATAISENSIIGIANAGVLAQLATLVNSGTTCTGKTIVLTDDIDLSDYQEGTGWTAIGTDSKPFNGTFDGQGHKITGLKINKSSTFHQGLFGVAEADSEIKNVGIVDCDIIGSNYTGGLVGCAIGTVNNSYSTGQVTGTNRYNGVLIGYAGGEVLNSYASGSVTGRQYTGGLVGYAEYTISNSYATGSVTGTDETGGLVGYTAEGSEIKNVGIVDCDVKGKNYTGGLVGYADGTITNSYATGSVTGTQCTGGLVGYVYGNVTNSYATGDVTGTNSTGGLVGYAYNNSTVTNSYATGNVTGTGESTGGLVGFANSSVTNCYATGSVTGTQCTGGLLGCSSYICTITNSYATGDVTGKSSTGGLVGYADGTITNSYATGSVSGTGNYTGGLVGSVSGSVTNSYATGDVSGTSWVGGLLGSVRTVYDDIELTNVALFGNVSGDTGVGLLIGSVYYNDDGDEDGSLTISNATVLNKSGMNGIGCGTYANEDTDYEQVIDPDYDLTSYLNSIKMAKNPSTTLQVGINGDESSKITFDTGFSYDLSAILRDIKSDESYNAINKFMSTLSDKATELGSVSNRLESALDSIIVNMENITSSLSTIKDADMATESSQYIKMQILQQASATLLATANQSPAIALQLI